MSGSGTIYTEQSMLGHTLGFAPMAFPAQVFVGLCSAAMPPSETVQGVEAFGNGYTRMPARFALIDTPANIAANVATVEYPRASGGWGTLGFFELWDAPSGGNRLYWGALIDTSSQLPITITVASGDIVRFSAGTLAVQATTGAGGTSTVGAYLPLAGGTLTGSLLLAGDPTTYLQAATKQYVDAHSGTGGGPGFLPLSGGTMFGPLGYTATGGTTSRVAQDRAADVANVLDFTGADPTGVADSTAAIRGAIATGKTVWLPRGSYRITGQLTLGTVSASQSMFGDGLNTTLLIDGGFDPSVTTGVVVFTGGNSDTQRPQIADLTFQFQQPDDIVIAATATSAAGTNTVTLASVTGIVVGMAVYDWTHTTAIPSLINGTSQLISTVSSIAGNAVTLSLNIAAPGVSSGDSIHFAPVRSMFKTLAAGGTATPGGTGVQYPWAIYCNGNVIAPVIRNVMVIGAWNGIYIRGSAFHLNRLDVGAFNVGLDVDNCFNFPTLTNYRFWPWGYGPNDPYVQARAALLNVYYDGNTIAANIGRTDGIAATDFQSWAGQLNIVASWSFGQFDNLMLDGNNANFNVTSTASGGWVKISNFYGTKAANTLGDAMTINPTQANFAVIINNLYMAISSTSHRGINQQNGRLAITGGQIWNGCALVLIQTVAGSFQLSNVMLDASPAKTGVYMHVFTGASIQLSDCAFVAAAGTGGTGLLIDADSTLISIVNTIWNGWGLSLPAHATGPNPSGNYGDVVRPAQDASSLQSGRFSFYNLPAAQNQDTAFGMGALAALTTGTGDTAMGYNAGLNLTTGSANTFLGTAAGTHVADGGNNVAVGDSALQQNISGANNTAVGTFAGLNATGSSNTCIGYESAQLLTTGHGNTVIGYQVGSTVLSTGNNNVLIGVGSGVTVPSDANNFFGLGGTGGVTFSAIGMDTVAPHWTFLGTLALVNLPTSATYANDAAAAAGGVPVGQLYRNGSAVQVRVA